MYARILTIDPEKADMDLAKDWYAGEPCVYPITGYRQTSFHLIHPSGKLFCLCKKCAQLGYGDWQILSPSQAQDYF